MFLPSLAVFLYLSYNALAVTFVTEDLFVPAECDSIARPKDNLLLEYNILFANGSHGASLNQPSQLYHVLLASTVRLSSL